MIQFLQQRPYPVVVGDSMRSSAWQSLLPATSASRWLLVTDTNTAIDCQPWLQQLLPAHELLYTVIPAGETNKHIGTVEYLWKEWQQALVGRDAHVLLLGGGVVGDLGAFAAATYGRGMPVTQIPTSLLAMVDAALGGKTGINVGGVKNMAGTFTWPHQVIIDKRWLSTLPEREYRSAMGEVLKYGLLQGGSLWQALQEGLTDGVNTDILRACAAYKLRLVKRDPYDRGARQLLNLGHTVGHALESWSHAEGKPLWHGEAIAIGLVYAVALSAASGKMTHSRAKKIMTTIRQYFPDLSLDATDWQQLQPWLQHDKKKKGGVITWVLPERPGRVDFGVTMPNPVWMEAAFETTQQYFPAS